jgi:hypothetical protein
MTDIFVFGSNLAGVHGAGAAKFARLHHGAIWGKGQGLQGTSYGIPTKDERIRTLPLGRINFYVQNFLDFAVFDRPDLTFYVTPIGCGLAGYKRHQIRPFFKGMPANCRFAETWEDPD